LTNPKFSDRPPSITQKKGEIGRGKLATIVTAREQRPVDIERHDDGGVAPPGLHRLRRQLQAAVDLSVDAP